jgi:hypothetical protein
MSLRQRNPDSTRTAFKRYSLTTLLAAGILLASTGTCSAQTADEAEAALAEAEVAVAKARVREALWLTAWNALLEARRTRISQDYAASVRWSVRAAELAGLGIAQAEHEARFPQGTRAGNTGGNP